MAFRVGLLLLLLVTILVTIACLDAAAVKVCVYVVYCSLKG